MSAATITIPEISTTKTTKIMEQVTIHKPQPFNFNHHFTARHTGVARLPSIAMKPPKWKKIQPCADNHQSWDMNILKSYNYCILNSIALFKENLTNYFTIDVNQGLFIV